MNKKKIAFLRRDDYKYPWMLRDLQILKKHFQVSILQAVSQSSLKENKCKILQIKEKLLNYLRLFIVIKKSGLTLGWFATTFAITGIFISNLLRKRSIIIVGGWDIESMPEINYGALRVSWRRRFVAFGLKRADMVLPFSEFAAEKVRKLTGKSNIRAANLACDTQRFKPEGPKADIVITVGFIDKKYVLRKGFKTFVESARYLPDIKFYLIGKQRDEAIDELKSIATPNVEFTGFLPDNDLLSMYQAAKVFCLLSYQEGEGGGGVLGEAMSCGCIPVVSTKAVALRETVGNCGFYVPYGNPEATAEAIKKALKAPSDLSERARKRIEEFYSMKQRESKLLNVIDDALKK